MEIFKKGSISFLYNILGGILGFAIQFFAAKILGASEFGKYNYFMGLVNTFGLLFTFGVAFYFPKIFQNKIDKRALTSGIFYTSTILLLITFPLIILFNKFSSQLEYFLFFLMTLSIISLKFYSAYLAAIGRFDLSTKKTNFLVRFISLVIFLIFIMFFSKSQYELIFATFIANVIIVAPFLWKKLKIIKPNIVFIKKAYIFYFIQIFYMFFGEYSKVLQGDFFNYKSVAYLSIALLIGQSITLFGLNFANVGMPIFANAFAKNDIKTIRIKFKEISRINAFFLIPVFFVIFFNSNLILGLFGNEFTQGVLMLKLILVGAFFNSIVGPNGTVLLMGNKSYLELFNGILKFVVVVATVYLFGEKYLWGVALAISLSDILVNLIKAIQVYYFYKIVPFSYKETIYIVIYGISVVIIFYISSIYFKNEIILILFNVIFVLLLWFWAFKLSPNKSDQILLKRLYFFRNS